MSILITPGVTGCPTRITPPSYYKTPWHIENASGGWWLDPKLPALQVRRVVPFTPTASAEAAVVWDTVLENTVNASISLTTNLVVSVAGWYLITHSMTFATVFPARAFIAVSWYNAASTLIDTQRAVITGEDHGVITCVLPMAVGDQIVPTTYNVTGGIAVNQATCRLLRIGDSNS